MVVNGTVYSDQILCMIYMLQRCTTRTGTHQTDWEERLTQLCRDRKRTSPWTLNRFVNEFFVKKVKINRKFVQSETLLCPIFNSPAIGSAIHATDEIWKCGSDNIVGFMKFPSFGAIRISLGNAQFTGLFWFTLIRLRKLFSAGKWSKKRNLQMEGKLSCAQKITKISRECRSVIQLPCCVEYLGKQGWYCWGYH